MRKISFAIFNYLSLFIWTIAVFFPLLTLVFGSFMTSEEFTMTKGLSLPSSFGNLENYRLAFVEGKMLRGFFITFCLVFFGVIGSVFIGSLVAYCINRFDFPFKKMIIASYFLVSMVPMTLSQVATFKVMTGLHLYNTIWAPILLYLGADVMMIYVYLQGMEKVPKELDRAALLEGASYFQIYRRVIFPLVRPATATVVLLKVISIYNDFYFPYLYMPSSRLNTVSTTIFRFVGPYQVKWEIICACIVISIIPMVLFFLFLHKSIYAGLTEGGVKE